HNPIQWNAFKLINATGSFLGPDEMNTFLSLVDTIIPFGARWNAIKPVLYDSSAADIHIEKVLAAIDVTAIRKSKFTVVLDSVNGAGSLITQQLLKKLGCRVIPIHCDMTSGTFPRGAEPVAKNLKALSKAVKEHKADIGFAQDPDADRLAIVDEKGNPIGEELTVTLAVMRCLAKKKGPVVVNMSTTKAIEDIASRFGTPVYRSKVGEIHVVEAMKKYRAVIGGEGNGGVISPEVHFGRDSLVGIGYCLELMAQSKKPISQIVASLPVYYMHKDTMTIDSRFDTGSIAKKIKEQYADEVINTLDGIRIDFVHHDTFNGGWVHLRPSNTEPIFRIIAEGKSKKQCEAIVNTFKTLK
ncbi:MAG: phosphoglucosamine mutase, partial [Spirochaetota bacterium]